MRCIFAAAEREALTTGPGVASSSNAQGIANWCLELACNNKSSATFQSTSYLRLLSKMQFTTLTLWVNDLYTKPILNTDT